MNITEMFLKAIENVVLDVRVTCQDRWMIMDIDPIEFTVFEKKAYQKITRVICRTQDQDLAISYLIGEREK